MEIVVRATVVFFFLWGLTRAMGKRELSEITPFELILLVIMGDLVQQGVTQEDMSITGAVLAVGTMSLLVLGTSYVSFRWKRSRSAIEGRPVIIVRDGTILHDVLRIERLTEDEVYEGAREQGIADLAEVRFCILETDGNFSFIREASDRSVPQSDADGRRTD